MLKKSKLKWDDISINLISYMVIGIFSILCLLPFIYVFTYSLTPYADYLRNPMNFFPRNIEFNAYKSILGYKLIASGYRNTLFITIVGTVLNLLLLIMTAYPLSKKNLKGSKFVFLLFVFTMFFSGGMIPNYYLIRNLKLVNNLWSLILPGILGAYNLILMINFIKEIPDSLEEAAIIDGASEVKVLFSIVLPLCIPAVVTLGLFHAVGAWNSYFSAILYMNKRAGWPLQLVLRELIMQSGLNEVQNVNDDVKTIPFTLQMAAIMVTTLPIMCVYPFLQKYFMKGLLLGGVKE
jgi:ABC-type glycerol-3-phosphate transport system permease component